MSKSESKSKVFDNLDQEMDKRNSGRFLRLENNGDYRFVYFAGNPLIRNVYWDGQHYREWSEDCGQKKVLRVAMNVIVCDMNKKVEILGVRVLEQGRRFFQQVSKLDKKYGIRDWIFKIERSGDKGETVTSYTTKPEYELSEREREKLEKIELIDLAAFYAKLGKKKSRKKHSKLALKEPIGEEQALELVRFFKTLENPVAEGEKFCRKFGIVRVKDLPESKHKTALDYLEERYPDRKISKENAPVLEY